MKYLFFSHDGKLGDAISHTALLSGILSEDSNAIIDCTASGYTLDFWRHDIRIRNIYEVDSFGWIDCVKLGFRLQKQHYDYLIAWNKHKSEKMRFFLWLIKPSALIISELDENQHVLTQKHQALRSIFNKALTPGFSLPKKIHNSEPFILINLFGGILERKRTIQKNPAIELITKIKNKFPATSIVLCCEDHTESQVRAILEGIEVGQDTISIQNCTPLATTGLIDLCGQSAMIISPDTSVVHIASALNKPIIAIYQNGNSKSKTWGPTSTKSYIIHSSSPDSIEGFDPLKIVEAITEINKDLSLNLS